MHIDSLQLADIPQLNDFYCLIHSENSRDEISSYVEHWLARTKNSLDYVTVQKEGSEIVGMTFFSPMYFYLRGLKYQSAWGFDLYVKERYRKEGYGAYMMMFNRKKFLNSFATGSNPNALALNKRLGCVQIGEIHKYVGIVNPLGLISSCFRGIVPTSKFPYELKVKGHFFKKISEEELPEPATPYNGHLLEISHDADFLKWKFFHSYLQYAFYLDSETNNYIVLRTIVKKHITMLMVADYRCNVNSDEELEILYQVARKVSNKIGVAFIFCGSSLCPVDKVFERHHFKAIGRHRPIISFEKECKKTEYVNDIQNRNFVLVTLSDSDGEPV